MHTTHHSNGSRTRLAATLLGLPLLAALGAASPGARADDGMATDRPDFVESSDVVGTGVVQIETSLAFERDNRDGIKSRGRSTPTLLRVGVSPLLELRLETDGLVKATVSDANGSVRNSGTADVALGLKWKLAEGGDGKPGMALLAHLDLDSGSAAFRGPGRVPSVRVVAEWELPGDGAFGVMPGIAWDLDAATGKRYARGILAATYSRPLADRLRGFVEVAGEALRSRSHGGNVATFNTGLTYAINADNQLDAVVNLGLTRDTPRQGLGIGYSRRFR